jgi:hypothetical protein
LRFTAGFEHPLNIGCISAGRNGTWDGKDDSIYFGFITATTVGYGDLHPRKNACKFVAIIPSIVGLIMTGILVALSLAAMGRQNPIRIPRGRPTAQIF